ncbi:MAG: DNA damage-inducible protein D [Candidatus Woesearchaeota archaeon]|jgi:DNA-damage-inducible protein D|nr:DNA damage-inducible protein D [Candidatus Woesearchaeota archaeon]MDP7198155.1 DNA damage-inducible protein D [Candidatus Woesearchaeota archaeon]MDP7466990.1 DNA damage-inducible protein D [Candidatus Woesearchaeota archaeon]MDP7646660.1 DNA damage-inducible protein D [Candidatus Woesearchaeota archaeon]
MKKEVIAKLRKTFEDYAYQKESIEFWFARDLQNLLGYLKWENFLKVIQKAEEACKNSGYASADHFPEVRKMVDLGSGAEREIDDYVLTRYACYLVAQNGDPRKEEIAFAQSYFAVQTRKQELIEERIAFVERLEARKKLTASEIEFSKLIYERGVDQQGFARIRSKGDVALFGGKTTLHMKKKLGVPKNRPMADFLPTITITAKNLATEITNFNVKKKNLEGEGKISSEHVHNNVDIRELLIQRGIKPEALPPEQDIKKLERRVKKEEKKIAKGNGQENKS